MNKLVGLDNVPLPDTRHNVGKMVLDSIAHSYNLSWTTYMPWDSDIAQTIITIEKEAEQLEFQITLLKPNKSINISVSCVARAVKDLSVSVNRVYVFHDDMQKELGKVSKKSTGSANGHNGVNSVIENLESTDFNRFRIGIGIPPHNDDRGSYDIVRSHVLSEEKKVLEKVIYPI